MGKKIWLSMHPRNFDSDKIVRTYLHPGFIYARVKFCISSTPRVSEVNRMVTPTFGEKKNNNNNKAESSLIEFECLLTRITEKELGR